MRALLATLTPWLVLVGCGGDSGSSEDADSTDSAPAETTTAGDTDATVAPETIAETSSDSADGGAVETEDAEVEVEEAQCNDDLDCRLPCLEGRCLDGRCNYDALDPNATGCAIGAPPECIATGAPSPERACLFCNPFADATRYSNTAFDEGFEHARALMLVERLTSSPASWTISTARAASGTHSLYFGDPALGTYDVGERAAARALTPPISLPPDADAIDLSLAFQLFADTEETPGFDRLLVRLIPPGSDPADGEVLWSSDEIGGSTLGEFLPISLPLEGLADGAQIAFEADTVDEIINNYEGFYLDSVRLRSSCCDAEAECDDGNPCTEDSCAEGLCRYVARASCCLNDSDCDDGDPCSDDSCQIARGEGGGSCVSVIREDCCAVASECDDSDPCTEDTCVIAEGGAGRCRQAPLCCAATAECDDGDACTIGDCVDGQCRYHSACCRDDADCDDGVACTLDRCDDGVCRNEFSYEVGCCIPDVLTERFEDGAPEGWTLSPPANNVGWRVHDNAAAPSGSSVLYYGHPTLNFYESGGRNGGSAITPLVRLPDGVELKLTFQVLLDIEDNPMRDLFEVEALIGQAVVPLVAKAELTSSGWQEVQVDLTWAASQAIQIRFSFDTVDGAQNTTRGIFIDDVRLLSSCLPRPCGVDAECGSRASCITGTCQEGICRYGGGC